MLNQQNRALKDLNSDPAHVRATAAPSVWSLQTFKILTFTDSAYLEMRLSRLFLFVVAAPRSPSLCCPQRLPIGHRDLRQTCRLDGCEEAADPSEAAVNTRMSHMLIHNFKLFGSILTPRLHSLPSLDYVLWLGQKSQFVCFWWQFKYILTC